MLLKTLNDNFVPLLVLLGVLLAVLSYHTSTLNVSQPGGVGVNDGGGGRVAGGEGNDNNEYNSNMPAYAPPGQQKRGDEHIPMETMGSMRKNGKWNNPVDQGERLSVVRLWE